MFEKYANLHLLAKSVEALYASGEQVLAKCVKPPLVEAKDLLYALRERVDVLPGYGPTIR